MNPVNYKGVMVSSTFTDLTKHRNALTKAINGQALKAISMENDAAKPAGDVIDSSLKMVRDSSAYVGIISHKYGEIPKCADRNPEGLSLTELEFNEARRLERPILLFIMGDDYCLKSRDIERDPEKDKKLKRFRENAICLKKYSPLPRIYKVFNDFSEFEVAATQSVADLRRLLENDDILHRSKTNSCGPFSSTGKSQKQKAVFYDNNPVPGKGIGDLNEAKLKELLESPLALDLTAEISGQYIDTGLGNFARLEHLGCLIDGKPTVGAFLCFGKQESFGDEQPTCILQMTNHNSLKRGGPNVSIKLASGNLFSLYDAGLTWLTSGNILRRNRLVGSPHPDDSEIPEIILREALVNALVHRDYGRNDLRAQPTRIDVYSDCVEITSYGELPDSIPLEKLNSPDPSLKPFRRNPIIARLFQCMGLAELNASGIERMRILAQQSKLRQPLFQTGHNYLCVKLFRPSTKLAVFVSSVQHELAVERNAISQLLQNDPILSRHFEPFLFEELPAFGGTIEDVILGAVDRCDIFLSILGNQYGYSHPNGISFTQLEFERAKMSRKPRLVFIKGRADSERDPRLKSFIKQADRKSTRLNSSHTDISRMPSSA